MPRLSVAGSAAVAATAIAASIFTATAAPRSAGGGDPLVQESAAVTVDWRHGTLAASGGAAADLRMPSADVARVGAERRARAAALERLAQALRALPLGGERHLDAPAVERALGRARTLTVEYQSNGGAVVRLEIPFGAWAESPPAAGAATVAVRVPALRLGAAPQLAAPGGGAAGAVALGSARYVVGGGVPAAVRSTLLKGRADKQGRIVIESASAADTRDLAGRPAVIYVEKILR